LSFERPIKGDLDRSLSLLMHDTRHKAMEECNRIKSDAIKAGALQSNRVIVTVAKAADRLHHDAMKQATPMLLDFIERMQLPPAEVTGWARPHLENLGNTLLGSIPPNGFLNDHQRIVAQYRAVFQQRLDDVLRDVEIGFVKGAGFARAERVESKEEWITAAEAVRLLKPVFNGEYMAQMTICKRAHSGLVRSRAEQFMMDEAVRNNFEIPKGFWWAEGNSTLTQNWTTGDFDTWIDRGEVHLRAFGVSFLRADIEKMIPASKAETHAFAVSAGAPSPAKGGRPKADWWEDLWIEICRQLYLGDLQPKTQADIERAMLQWVSDRNETVGETIVRTRASKLWKAIQKDEN
jgi:hypothetical protein